MARALNRLPSNILKTVSEDGWHHDGGGLYLRIDGANRRWSFVFRWRGKRAEMGLGSASVVDLKAARRMADEYRRAVAEGRNPRAERQAARAAVEPEKPKTFGEVATDLIDGIEAGFKNAKHRQQWRNTLTTHAAPLWGKPVAEITTNDVLAVLQPIWTKTPETASRTRGRIERVLDAAKAKGLREGENVARWRGHMDIFLPKRPRGQKRHHAAMPFNELPAFMSELRQRRALAALALEWTILTAARTSETLGATWSEIDLQARVWAIPAKRMKAGKEHRVPLSDRAVDIARELLRRSNGAPEDKLFPGAGAAGQLSNMSMEMLLRRMDKDHYTVHGTARSTFRDWVGECTDWSDRLAEQALAHALSDKVEAAYRRGTAFEKRRMLMEEWADFCAGAAEPIEMREAG